MSRGLVCQPSGPGSIPGMSRSMTAITRGNPIMLLPPNTVHVLHAYVLTCLQDSWPGIGMKGFRTCNLIIIVIKLQPRLLKQLRMQIMQNYQKGNHICNISTMYQCEECNCESPHKFNVDRHVVAKHKLKNNHQQPFRLHRP